MWNDRAQSLDQQAELMISTVQRIVRELEPTDTERLMPPRYSSNDGEGRVRRALGALRDLADVEVHLAATSPELTADKLHPTVWKSASVIWGIGEYRTSVGQAALSLEATVRARAASRLSGKKLMQDVFSPDAPKPGGDSSAFRR